VRESRSGERKDPPVVALFGDESACPGERPNLQNHWRENQGLLKPKKKMKGSCSNKEVNHITANPKQWALYEILLLKNLGH